MDSGVNVLLICGSHSANIRENRNLSTALFIIGLPFHSLEEALSVVEKVFP